MNKQDIDFTQSSGNVFADLGLADAREFSVKAQLVLNLKRLMKLHGLTQKEVARRTGSDQSTISKVLRGRLDQVTADRLLVWLTRLDQEVMITVRDHLGRNPQDHSPAGKVQVFSCG